MSRNSSATEEALTRELEAVTKLYKSELNGEDISQLPPLHLDSKILTEARIEIENTPIRRPQLVHSFWRKWELPAFAMSILTVTVFALQLYWPKDYHPVQVESTDQQSVEIVIESEQPVAEKKSVRPSLPDFEPPVQPPRMRRSAAPRKPESEVIASQEAEQLDVGSLANGGEPTSVNSTGTAAPLADGSPTEESPNAPYKNNMAPVKSAEAWAAEIIELVKQGHQQQAKTELNAFKKQYPNYPIDEQLSVLRGLR